MNVGAALRMGTQMLRDAGIADPARDARKLMASHLEIEAGRLTLHLADEFDDLPEVGFFADILERGKGMPVSHLLGWREFYGRRFSVSSDVLDPRPETESLIEAALASSFSDVLDLGTGSGAIIVTLLAERPDAVGIATEISSRALAVARENATSHQVEDRVQFEECSWFSAIGGQFDLIVSNPPYIALDEMDRLAPELSFEPRMALTDEGDGLAAYRVIARDVGDHLKPGGRLLVEIGWQQAKDVHALFQKAGLTDIQVIPDLDGRDRVVSARKY
ncbi:peptide chain release factor N(5)-glutamine methyltransferase [Shimia sp.]|uniref:peptide chain release factor N(5)-glutamine methyltransferase n=1 Tax=Shimia sp. TaxID=1954381 RepID=UPI003298A117